jgi:hypothetical protein
MGKGFAIRLISIKISVRDAKESKALLVNLGLSVTPIYTFAFKMRDSTELFIRFDFIK